MERAMVRSPSLAKRFHVTDSGPVSEVLNWKFLVGTWRVYTRDKFAHVGNCYQDRIAMGRRRDGFELARQSNLELLGCLFG